MEYEFSFWFSIILEDVCDFQIKYQKLQQKEVTKTQQDPSFGKQKTSVQRASNRPRTPPPLKNRFFSLNSTIFKFFQENF